MKRMMLVVVASRSIASVAQALMLLLLARLVGAADFGELSAYLGIGAFVTVLLDFGVTTYVLRERVLAVSGARVAASVRLSRMSALLVLLTMLAVYGIFFRESMDAWTAVLLAAWFAVERTGEMWVSVLLADQREFQAATTLLLRRLVPFAIMIPLVAFAAVRADLAFAAGSVVGGLVANFLAPRMTLTPIPRSASWKDMRETLMLSRPFWLFTAASQSRELEPTLVNAVLGPLSAGWYALAFRLSKPVLLVAAAVANVLVPTVTRAHPDFARKALIRVSVIAVAATVVGVALTPVVAPLIELVVGPDFEGATRVTQIMLVTIGFVSISAPLSAILQALYLEHFIATIGLTCAVLSLGGLLVGAAVLRSVEAAMLFANGGYVVNSLALLSVGLWKTRRMTA